jgi:hypothetical protein
VSQAPSPFTPSANGKRPYPGFANADVPSVSQRVHFDSTSDASPGPHTFPFEHMNQTFQPRFGTTSYVDPAEFVQLQREIWLLRQSVDQALAQAMTRIEHPSKQLERINIDGVNKKLASLEDSIHADREKQRAKKSSVAEAATKVHRTSKFNVSFALIDVWLKAPERFG